VPLAVHLYPRACIAAAADAFASHAAIDIDAASADLSLVTITPLPGPNDPVVIRREFLNYVLDLSLQQIFKFDDR